MPHITGHDLKGYLIDNTKEGERSNVFPDVDAVNLCKVYAVHSIIMGSRLENVICDRMMKIVDDEDLCNKY